MGFKCEVCQSAVPSGVPAKRHIVRRADGSVKQEMKVCADCDAGFRCGYSLAKMLEVVGPKPDGAMLEAVKSLSKTAPTAAPPPGKTVVLGRNRLQ